MAALGLRSVVLLAGAGYTGTYLYNHFSFERARNLAADILIKHRENAETGSSAKASGNSTQGNSSVDTLSKQVDRLTREVSRSRDQVLVVGGNSAYKSSLAVVTDVFNLLGWAVIALSVGGVVYYFAFRKRLSLRDLAWVSHTRFNDTVNAMQSGISRVSSAVGSVRRDLGERMRKMEGKVGDVETNLSKQIESEVGDVKEGVNKLGEDVSLVSRGVEHVHTRIDEMNDKIEGTHQGVQMLLDFITSLAPEKVKPGTPFYNLQRFMRNRNSASNEIEGSTGLRPRLTQTGLAGLLPGMRQQKSSAETNGTESKRRSMDVPSPSWSIG